MSSLFNYDGPHSALSPSWIGKGIAAAAMNEERITLTFLDGSSVAIVDNGQSCCEHRYMTTDDDIQSLVGHNLLCIEAKEGPDMESGEEHETVFVEVATDGGFVTIVNHNEHNGYYGGFSLDILEDPQ